MRIAQLVGWRTGTLLVVAVALIAAAGWATAVAHADGDPASDYLFSQSVFLSTNATASQRAQLVQLAATSKSHGAPIRVAIISSAYDLGSITPLWLKPQTYAAFLGAELSYVYHGRLLVVMPNGFGVYDGKRPVTTELGALRGIAIKPGLDGLVAAAASAVRAIASADGHPLPATSPVAAAVPTRPRRSGGFDLIGTIVVGAGLVLIVAAWTVSLRLRPSRWVRFVSTTSPQTQGRRSWLRRRMSRSAILMVGVPIALIGGGAAAVFAPLGTSSRAPQPLASSSQGFTWPAGTRPAPAFTLRDQHGTPISLRDFRGRGVILAFVDPVCRNLCPLEASLIGDMERRLSARSRPDVVAVSVNPWGNARSHLLQDVHNWRVGSEWRWAVGSHEELARVWRAYEIGVQVKRLKVAGQTVREISHTEVIYLIDGNGDERQVIPYPFTVASLIRSIRRLEPT